MEMKLKKFVCAQCGRSIEAISKYDKRALEFVYDFGVDVDEFDDSSDELVIHCCRFCKNSAG